MKLWDVSGDGRLGRWSWTSGILGSIGLAGLSWYTIELLRVRCPGFQVKLGLAREVSASWAACC